MAYDRLLFASLIVVVLFPLHLTNSAKLAEDEVNALRDIAKKLKKTNWNFSGDPCDPGSGWVTLDPEKGFENNVTCNCSFANSTVCHVTTIALKEQNLQGMLPPELARLRFLQQIDLSRNYLTGSIPAEWGALPLLHISLMGNRLTGPIPEEIGNISTLVQLNLESNQFSGELPPELGNLRHLERMLLSSNNFSGQIPSTLSKLTKLKDFRIADNQFSGKIPDYIRNWRNLQKLVIQASGLVGPVPDTIASLSQLADLRISDLNGPESPFPPLANMMKMKILILRNCNLTGPLPEHLGGRTSLKLLDLSFNNLNGGIPKTYSGLSRMDYIYLTGNKLTGTIPPWLLNKGNHIDLSYNNFTAEASVQPECQHARINLFGSSLKPSNSTTVSCLQSYHCPKTFYGFHVNSGGDELTVNGTAYDADIDKSSDGASNFYDGRKGWVMSSTGHFLDDERNPKGSFTWTNSSKLAIANSQLYTQARLAAISLTYYGICLANGNYTVNLHFAEIMFTDDKTYSSLGRRLFDIYIQGKRVQKDFNIRDEAGGAGKAIVKKFPVMVTNNTVEIRLYWAGKGTNAIPTRGVYGPLISAVSVNPDFVTPKDPTNSSSDMSVGAVVGVIAAATLLLILLVGVILWTRCCLRQKSQIEQDFKNLDFLINAFSLRQIKTATNNFDAANKIGEGGFGPVFKGKLSDGTVIAVKQLSSKSKQGNREFLNEIGMISALQHPHLVKLYGCCVEGDQLLLIYEYLENNSLARALFGPEESQLRLNWRTRRNVCIGIAKGLAYLHEESRLKIVHRDIKATNVLLDKNLNPKISDFGMAKLDEEDDTHISTRVAGTFGYMAPEYAMRGHLTEKADVYSYGVVVLETVSGRSNSNRRSKGDHFYLLDWVNELKEKDDLLKLVDSRLGQDYSKQEAMVMINVALICTSEVASDRPSMSSVVNMLEGRTAIYSVPDASFSKKDRTARILKRHYELLREERNQSDHSLSSPGPFSVSSTSAGDHYPANLHSGYSNGRA